MSDVVIEGPDLNGSRSPLDKKLYRQILLPNGLRAVLISDTVAMHQEFFYDDDDDDDDEDNYEEDQEEGDTENAENDKDGDEEGVDKNERSRKRIAQQPIGDSDGKGDDGEDDEDDKNDGLRDAAAALVVGVGSMYDPPEAQGLAHFLEHMLFMGTSKYPEENAYDSFLSKHGGSDNAYTELEYTVYHLTIPQEKLLKALDMFAQFFIEPLMLPDAVKRELNSIESEFQLVRNSDQCRLQQLMIHTSGCTVQEHPFNKFAWGNLKSLKEIPSENGVDIMDLLRKFYRQYYFAANMSLVVIGAYTLDELQKEVVKCFSDIPPEPREEAPWPLKYSNIGTWEQTLESPMASYPLPMQSTSLQKVYRLPPVRDRHSLSMTWQVPSQIPFWDSRPCDYLSHLLGHEAQGSVLASLKEKSWATGCFVGVGSEGVDFASSHALFMATFSLSEEGMDRWQEVVHEIFVYIGMLRYFCMNGGLPDWIYEELRLIDEVAYLFRDEEPPEDLVENFAERMAPHFKLPPERLLDGQDLLFQHNEGAVKDLLDNYLTPTKVRIDILSSKFGRAADFDKESSQCKTADNTDAGAGFGRDTAQFGEPEMEPRFGTCFWRCDLDKATIAHWTVAATAKMPSVDSMLSLPPRNPFVPEKLDLKPLPPDDGDHPLLNSSLKLCISVGKRKSWFPATVTKYNTMKNSLLLSYEDEDAKWHKLDHQVSELTPSELIPGFEGFLDNKKIKFRLVALAKEGEGAVMKFGDETDFKVEEGLSFPAIPPSLPESRLPKLVHNSNGIKMWHLQDRKFKRPIAELRLRLICSGANRTPLHAACADLFVSLVSDAVTETSYLASVCELGSTITRSDVSFGLRVNGFDDKLLHLFTTILEAMLSFRGRRELGGLPGTIRPGRFEACLEVLKRRYANAGLKASKASTDIRIRCLRSNTWSEHAKAQSLTGITEGSFTATTTEIMNRVTAEILYHGNTDGTDVAVAREAITALIDKSGGSGLSKKKYPAELVTKLPLEVEPLYVVVPTKNPAEPNNAVEIYFQVGKDRIDDRVMTDLLTHMMCEPLYDQVRTKDQFGYSVSCDSRWTNGIMGIYFYVVSSTKSAADITARIDKFIRDYREELLTMKDEDFMEHLVGIAKNKLEMFNSLSEECDCYWNELVDGRLDFQANRNEVLALRSFTKERALKSFDEWLSPEVDGKPNKRRVLIVQVIGTTEGEASSGRPEFEGDVESCIEDAVTHFHKSVGNTTWGRVY